MVNIACTQGSFVPIRVTEELGEARWKAIKKARCLLKIAQAIACLLTLVSIICFESQAFVHDTSSNAWFNVTASFPFRTTNQTVSYTNQTGSSTTFEFAKGDTVWSLFYVTVMSASLFLMLTLLLGYLYKHGSEGVYTIAYMDWCSSAILAGIIFISSGLWFSTMKTMEGRINEEINTAAEFVSCGKQQEKCRKVYITTNILLLAMIFGCISGVLLVLSFAVTNRFTNKSSSDKQTKRNGLELHAEYNHDIFDMLNG